MIVKINIKFKNRTEVKYRKPLSGKNLIKTEEGVF
jgi:hypothetical protein